MSQADGLGKDGALRWMYEGNSGHTAEDVLTGKVRLDATDVRKSVGLQKDNEKELYSSSSSSFIGSSMLGARATTLDIPRRGQGAGQSAETAAEGSNDARAVEQLREQIRQRVRAAKERAMAGEASVGGEGSSARDAVRPDMQDEEIRAVLQGVDRKNLDELVYRLLRQPLVGHG